MMNKLIEYIGILLLLAGLVVVVCAFALDEELGANSRQNGLIMGFGTAILGGIVVTLGHTATSRSSQPDSSSSEENHTPE